MANWTDTVWEVVLPTKNVKPFLKGFLFDTYGSREAEVIKRFGSNESKKRYVNTFVYIETLHEEEYTSTLTRLRFSSTCRWSFRSTALIDTALDGFKQVSIDAWCLKHDVRFLNVVSDELGMSFRETFFYDKDNDVDFVYDCRTIDYFTCEHCDTYGIWEDYPEDSDKTICPECGCKFEEDDE